MLTRKSESASTTLGHVNAQEFRSGGVCPDEPGYCLFRVLHKGSDGGGVQFEIVVEEYTLLPRGGGRGGLNGHDGHGHPRPTGGRVVDGVKSTQGGLAKGTEDFDRVVLGGGFGEGGGAEVDRNHGRILEGWEVVRRSIVCE